MTRIRLVLAALVSVAWLAGCGGETTTVPDSDAVTGRFAGTDDAGIGVAVDFGAFDRTTEAIRATLDPKAVWSVGLVSIVNRSNELKGIPALFVTGPSGRVHRLARATVVRRTEGGPKEELPAPGPFVPQNGAITLYVLFRGKPTDIRRLEMRVGVGPIVELTPQRPAKSPGGGG
jgi:hypothetical protein